MKYKIVVDSSANINNVEGVDFASVPLTIITDEKEYVDNSNLDINEMVAYLGQYEGKSGTACPSVDAFLQAFDGAEAVFCFTLTSNLSGAYNSARIAKEDYEEENEGSKVFVVDTLSTGPEMRLLVEKTLDLINEGSSFEEISEAILEYKEKTGLLFGLESMNNLANNGRVSHIVAKLAGVLGIRIVGRASDEGTLELLDKYRGEKKSILKALEHMKELGYVGGKVRIDHVCNPEIAIKIENAIKNEYPDADILIGQARGLCSFYAEQGGFLIGFEKTGEKISNKLKKVVDKIKSI